MDDLISRQAAIEAIERMKPYHQDADDIAEMIANLPSAEVEPVVRCKDCKHYNAGFECLIEGYGIERNNDWFCGDAERRTGG